MNSRLRQTTALGLLLLAGKVCAPAQQFRTACGDAGHFLKAGTRVYLHNPTGEAFSFTVHRFEWAARGEEIPWNARVMHVRLTAPDANVLVDEHATVEGIEGKRYEVPAGPTGVYMLEPNADKEWRLFYVTSSLRRSVVSAEPVEPPPDTANGFPLLLNPFVPRRWHFWVPRGTASFKVRPVWARWISPREDYGITVFSPRGQRMQSHWGQIVDTWEEEARQGEEARFRISTRHDVREIFPEPGSDGRFWSVEVALGDSHTYTDVSFCLEGVPPYLARCPEEWFNPETGEVAPVTVYDDSQFMHSARDERARNRNGGWWSPVPSLGDPDGVQIRCPAKFALWNPEGREMGFRLGTYVRRNPPETAAVRATGADGRLIFSETTPLRTECKNIMPTNILRTGKGVATVEVTGAEHFMAFTYPATPLVLIGEEAGEGWNRFRLEGCGQRYWFFLVPEGTKEFSVRAEAVHDKDVADLEVNAPDRLMARIYGRSGEQTVRVPPDLAGRIWHIAVRLGSASRIETTLPRPRFPTLSLTLDLKGVPPYLSPSWEQWFNAGVKP